jgi:oligoendopeptidase F
MRRSFSARAPLRAAHTPTTLEETMMRVVATLAALVLIVGSAHAAERADVPARYRWSLVDLYATPEAWTAARADIERRIPGLEAFQGRLGVSGDSLLAALTTYMDLDRDLTRLGVYASMWSDQDTRESRPLEMRQDAEQLDVRFRAAASWIRPELIGLGPERVRALIATNARLAPFRPWLEDLLRSAAHTLGPSEERIVAKAGALTGTAGTIRDLFTNAELPYPEITLASGERVRLDASAYTKYRQERLRADRDSVFHAFWGGFQNYRGTLGASLDGLAQAHVFTRDVRKFDSCLEASLFRDNIPPRVYTQLLADVHTNLPTLHRYLKLRQRMMGLDTLRYSDVYAPIVKSVALTFTPEQAMTLTLDAVAPLGKMYVDTLRHGFQHGWVDWMPNTGKASGAYSTGAYGVHPYQLQNFTGLYDEVGTLAHESGHSMHTWLADRHQPYVSHDYATFVAEVASTLNENLLFHHMLDRTKDKPTRLFLLGSYLDNLRGTLFRQTMFAEFELRFHEKAERGETLTGDNLNALYLDLVRTYYGDSAGVCKVDPLYAVEWAYIDHFFYNFYVYQYATSIVASTALANGIRDEARRGKARPKRDAYLRMMSAGSSKYPIDLLKDAGVDMTTSAPFAAAMREMNAVMDEMEKLLR